VPVDAPHDLYGLPLDRFIPERAALAKALRAEKRRDEAGDVAALRKPSVAAWAVNQLVRTQAKQIQALFESGDDLVQAQADAAAGKRAGDAMRDATRRQRDVVDGLVEAARGLLSSDGHPLSQTTLERVGDTLRAAAIDPDARQQVEEGCLAQELRFVGLGLGDALTAPPPRAAPKSRAAPKGREQPKPKEKPKKASGKEGDAARRKTEAAAQAEAERKRKAALKAARHAEADARRAATRADKELTAARARRDEAATSLDEAERLLGDAEAKAERVATELGNAERAVSELTED